MEFDFQHALKTVFAFAGLGTLVYQVAAAFYRGAPLRVVVNPHRRQWLIAGGSVMAVAYSAITLSSEHPTDPMAIFTELQPLFHEGRTSSKVIAGAVFLLLGLGLILSVLYCWWMYPRDPKSFDKGRLTQDAAVRNVRNALYHYAVRRGGMEYAAVIVLPPAGQPLPTVEQLVASHNANGPDAPPYRLLDWLSEGEIRSVRRRRHLGPANREELASARLVWLSMALATHPRAREQAVPCLQTNLGDVILIQTRTRFGGIILEYLYPSKDGEPDFLLFGVAMNAGADDGNRFYEHFAMLRWAVRYVLPDKFTLGTTICPTELPIAAATLPSVVGVSTPAEATVPPKVPEPPVDTATEVVAPEDDGIEPEKAVEALVEPQTAEPLSSR